MFFERYTGEDSLYYFNFRFGDGVIFTSLGYNSPETRDSGLENTKISGINRSNYVIFGKNFTLNDSNGALLGTSKEFSDSDECEVIIRNTIESISSAPIIDN